MKSYVNLSVDILTHPKCLNAGPNATALWIKSLLYSEQHCTQSFIPTNAVALIGVGMDRETLKKAEESCVAAGLWGFADGGFSICNDEWAVPYPDTDDDDLEDF